MELNNEATDALVQQPLFSFGVIADIQYADIPDGRSFNGVPRSYRRSMLLLQNAVQKWNSLGNLRFVINFGDIVDGFCPRDQSLQAVQEVVTEFGNFRNGRVYHMVGNHCLYNNPREDLLPLLNIPNVNNGCAYYDFSPAPGYRFVILDGYDVSVIGWPRDHPNATAALNILNENNPNDDKNSADGLVGVQRRFLLCNGGVGKKQMTWLNCVLQKATCLKEKVVVCCHLPLDQSASSDEALLWNYEEAMCIIHSYECVKACLAGHYHRGGYSADSHGVHHRVLEAVLECPPGHNAFGYINVYEDRLSLVGSGVVGSTEMVFDSNGNTFISKLSHLCKSFLPWLCSCFHVH